MDIGNMCRTCLSIDHNLESPFKTNIIKDTSITISDMIFSCTNIQLSDNDIFPTSICTNCKTNVVQFYKFREKTIEADKYFRSYFHTNDSSKESLPSNVCDIKEEEHQIPNFAEVILKSEHYDENSCKSSDSPCDIINENVSDTDNSDSENEINKLDFENNSTDKKEYKLVSENTNEKINEIDTNWKDMSETDVIENNSAKVNKEDFQCCKCNNTYKHFASLRRHMMQAHGMTNFLIKDYHTQTNRSDKNTAQSGNKCHECTICGKIFNRGNLLSNHMAVHSKNRPFQCELCGKCFKLRQACEIHLKTHSDNTIQKDRKRLPDTRICNVCGEVFENVKKYYVHYRLHFPKKCNKCTYCDKIFHRKHDYEIHIMNHTGEKPYKCELCDYRCGPKGSLKIHMRSHSNERPFKCDICDFRFKTAIQLADHKVTHTQDGAHKCVICNKNFNRATLLKKHMGVHSEEKPFQCEYCGKDFKFEKNFQVHIRVHTREEKYLCNFCDKKTIHYGSMRYHIKKVHNETSNDAYTIVKNRRKYGEVNAKTKIDEKRETTTEVIINSN